MAKPLSRLGLRYEALMPELAAVDPENHRIDKEVSGALSEGFLQAKNQSGTIWGNLEVSLLNENAMTAIHWLWKRLGIVRGAWYVAPTTVSRGHDDRGIKPADKVVPSMERRGCDRRRKVGAAGLQRVAPHRQAMHGRATAQHAAEHGAGA